MLSLADKNGIAKYARTYIQRYTHTHTPKKIEILQKKKERKKKRGGNSENMALVVMCKMFINNRKS